MREKVRVGSFLQRMAALAAMVLLCVAVSSCSGKKEPAPGTTEGEPPVQKLAEPITDPLAKYLPEDTMVYGSINIRNYRAIMKATADEMGQDKVDAMYEIYKDSMGLDFQKFLEDLDTNTKDWFEGEIAFAVSGTNEEIVQMPNIAVMLKSKDAAAAGESVQPLIELAIGLAKDFATFMNVSEEELAELDEIKVNFLDSEYDGVAIHCFVPEGVEEIEDEDPTVCWASLDGVMLAGITQKTTKKYIDAIKAGNTDNKFVKVHNDSVRQDYTMYVYVEGKKAGELAKESMQASSNMGYDEEFLNDLPEEYREEFEQQMKDAAEASEKQNKILFKELEAMDGALLCMSYTKDFTLLMSLSLLLDKEKVAATDYILRVTEMAVKQSKIDEVVNDTSAFAVFTLNNIGKLIELVKKETGEEFDGFAEEMKDNTDVDLNELIAALGDEVGFALLDFDMTDMDSEIPEFDAIAALEVKDADKIKESLNKIYGAMKEEMGDDAEFEMTETEDGIMVISGDEEMEEVFPEGKLFIAFNGDYMYLGVKEATIKDFMSGKKGTAIKEASNIKLAVNMEKVMGAAMETMDVIAEEMEGEEVPFGPEQMKDMLSSFVKLYGPLSFAVSIRSDRVTISLQQEINKEALKDIDLTIIKDVLEMAKENMAKAEQEAIFYNCGSFLYNIQSAQESYMMEYGVYSANIDDLSPYLYECYGMEEGECDGLVQEVLETSSCKPESLSIELLEDGYDYNIIVVAADAGECRMCLTPYAYNPYMYSECDPDAVTCERY